MKKRGFWLFRVFGRLKGDAVRAPWNFIGASIGILGTLFARIAIPTYQVSLEQQTSFGNIQIPILTTGGIALYMFLGSITIGLISIFIIRMILRRKRRWH